MYFVSYRYQQHSSTAYQQVPEYQSRDYYTTGAGGSSGTTNRGYPPPPTHSLMPPPPQHQQQYRFQQQVGCFMVILSTMQFSQISNQVEHVAKSGWSTTGPYIQNALLIFNLVIGLIRKETQEQQQSTGRTEKTISSGTCAQHFELDQLVFHIWDQGQGIETIIHSDRALM